MSVVGSNIIAGSSGQSTVYDIDQSLRFNFADSAYLSRTPGSAGNQKTWTVSFWFKKAGTASAADPYIIVGGSGTNPITIIGIDRNEKLWLRNVTSSGYDINLLTTQVFRDSSAWYHIVVAMDTTQGVEANRTKIYVNGSQVTAFDTATYPTLNLVTGLNDDTLHEIMKGDTYHSGYLAEFHSIDGTALTQASFGETNEDTNQWQAAKYSGSYGTNGFYLKFQDSAALGDDSSGNTNDFAATNLVATDQVLDSPSLNYCTLNPLQTSRTSGVTLSEGNLKLTSDDYYKGAISTIAVNSGKWYWELCNVTTDYFQTGFTTIKDFTTVTGSDYAQGQYVYKQSNVTSLNGYGTLSVSGGSNTMAAAADGDIYHFALDLDDGRFYMGVNGTWTNSSNPATGTNYFYGSWYTAGNYYSPFTTNAPSSNQIYNFGQDSSFAGNKTAQGNGGDGEDFHYTPPAGYVALSVSNLSDPAIALPTEYFDTTVYAGTAATHIISSLSFQPDFLWIKARTQAYQNSLRDSIRGSTKTLRSNDTGVEETQAASVTSFNSDGWSMGADPDAYVNYSTSTYVGWAWKGGGTPTTDNLVAAGGTPTAGSVKIDGANLGSALAGSIAATRLSANTTSGISIVSYTGTGSAATVGHGLGQTPEFFTVKSIDVDGRGWTSWVDSLTGTQALDINGTDAVYTSTTSWNSSLPTSTVINLGTRVGTNESGTEYIGYFFNSIEGYSKIGTYSSNNSADGPFLYLGFTPAYILLKCTSAVDNWNIYDIKRDGYNGTGGTYQLRADSAAAGFTAAGTMVDLVSNGMKIRTNDPGTNGSGRTYIYYAVAESPFKTSNAR